MPQRSRKRVWNKDIEEEIMRVHFGTLCDSSNYNCDCECCNLVNTWDMTRAAMTEHSPDEEPLCLCQSSFDRSIRSSMVKLKYSR